jgi:serine/threonine protein kinase
LLALKEFCRPKDNRAKDFQQESSMLVQLAKLNHRHLIRLLTAFQHGENYYALFPLAKCTLADCFANEDKTMNRSYTIWMFSQLHGLAHGLNTIHENGGNALSPKQKKHGYHHDLKPANLLLFVKYQDDFEGLEAEHGRLLISDFGLGKIRDQLEGTHTYSIRGTPTYAAPETRPGNGIGGGERPFQSRKYDIWSFGCIVLEIMVWLMEGPTGPKHFAMKRFV